MISVYGLKNCDTCRKAQKWLKAEGIAFTFQDLSTIPPDKTEIKKWLESIGAEKLINRRSTTWRDLDETTRQIEPELLLTRYPKLIKRPIFDIGDLVLSGFDACVKETIGHHS